MLKLSCFVFCRHSVHCVPKTCDHIFDNKFSCNCPFTKIVGALIANTRSPTGVFNFPAHLLIASALTWQTIKT